MFSYEKYKAIREAQGKSDMDVSFDTRLVPATFTNWKQKKYTPKIDKIERIASALGVTPDAFRETA